MYASSDVLMWRALFFAAFVGALLIGVVLWRSAISIHARFARACEQRVKQSARSDAHVQASRG